MFCNDNNCGCAIRSSDGSASITGSGTPDSPWDFHVGDASAVADLEEAVASILASLAALPGTYVNVTGDTMNGSLTVNAPGTGLRVVRTGNTRPYIEFYDQTNTTRQAVIVGALTGLEIVTDEDLIRFITNGVDRVRLASGTFLLPKAASSINTAGTEIAPVGAVWITRSDVGGSTIPLRINKISPATSAAMATFELSGTSIGAIVRNGATSAVLYNTTSDADLKNVIGPIDPELAAYVLRLVTPLFFSWKDDEGNTPITGYIAQQVAKVWPQSIELGIVTPGYGDITKREFDEDGNDISPEGTWGPWQMSLTGLIPVLHAGWIWLADKAEDHDQRLRALEDA